MAKKKKEQIFYVTELRDHEDRYIHVRRKIIEGMIISFFVLFFLGLVLVSYIAMLTEVSIYDTSESAFGSWKLFYYTAGGVVLCLFSLFVIMGWIPTLFKEDP